MQKEFMRRAIALARNGAGFVSPNPLVGAVIVKEGRMIGEGYHARYGDHHAERNALENCTSDCSGAEIYVTLEPCCHYGKQPPCTQAIIEHQIKKVYIGSVDPNPLMAGKGIEILRSAGIAVETQVCKEECDTLNPVFFHYIQNKTPYVVMKYAMTLDGKTACETGESQWVTGERARANVQKTRHELTGIMVGAGTVIQDDPRLTCRIKDGKNPVRIICDSRLRTPLNSQVVESADTIPTIIATICRDTKAQDAFREKKVDILVTREEDGRVDLRHLMELLGEREIDSILLEGGGTLNQSALEAGIVQHVQAYIAPKMFGGNGGYSPVTGQGVDHPEQAWKCRNRKVTDFGDDILLEYDID